LANTSQGKPIEKRQKGTDTETLNKEGENEGKRESMTWYLYKKEEKKAVSWSRILQRIMLRTTNKWGIKTQAVPMELKNGEVKNEKANTKKWTASRQIGFIMDPMEGRDHTKKMKKARRIAICEVTATSVSTPRGRGITRNRYGMQKKTRIRQCLQTNNLTESMDHSWRKTPICQLLTQGVETVGRVKQKIEGVQCKHRQGA